ncbi:MAG: NAD-dependent DNA ligase LigA [Candidatus Paceibacterota bacterium]|jgi:DNA ligase (NAD+)
MNKQQAKERIGKLRKLIDYHRNLYHTFDEPEINDSAFDTLKNELEELEYKFPDLITSDSPTQKVGGKPLDKFEKVSHEKPMLSFNDAFSEEEMNEWMERLENYLGRPLTDADSTRTNAEKSRRKSASSPRKSASLFYCELKIDGLAIELIYENGILKQGATRGDGIIGEDITQNLKTVKAIPQRLEQLGKYKIPKHLVVRGEVFITKKDLVRINKEQQKLGLKSYANTRNLAAGSVRQLDPQITASRKLDSFQYDIVTNVGQKTHEEEHKILASWGFKINLHNKSVTDLNNVFEFRNYWEKKRESLGYEIDGIVVIVNDNSSSDKAGSIGKAPRAAIAYKFSPRQATTIIEDIKVQVGRTGTLTPVAILKPVEISGVTITHATLHNFDEIKRLGVKIDDTVIITRSGDVIPKIIQVIKELRTGKEKEFKVPLKCPVDGSGVIKDGVMIKCSNPSCGAKNRNQIIHFVSRNAFDIRGLGKKIIDRFLDEGLITNSADIFSLEKGDISVLERFGKKSADNLIKEISQSKKIRIDKFIYALGILHVGQETASLLSKKIQSSGKKVSIVNLKKFLSNISLEKLQELQDVGPKVAQSIYSWFSDKKNQKLLDDLNKFGIELEVIKEKTSGVFKGLNICLTGTLESMSRQRAKEIIESRGGHFHSDVLSSTDIVIAGENPGSKYNKAKDKGIEVWDEKKFLNKI